MKCDCSIDPSYDTPEFYTEMMRTARKEHICCECREKISPGKKYEIVSGKWNGEFNSYKTCLGCKRIREHYCPSGWYFGELRETLIECLDFDYITSKDTRELEE